MLPDIDREQTLLAFGHRRDRIRRFLDGKLAIRGNQPNPAAAELGHAFLGKLLREFAVAPEVAFHRTVNNALRTLLIPGAKNAELKALLETGLRLFGEHQMHAEHLASELG